MKIKAILFDFIGTIVKEKNSTVITRCLSEAFIENDFYLSYEFLDSKRQKDNVTFINNVLNRYKLPPSMTHGIYTSFKRNLEKSIENFGSFDESLFVFSYLIRMGISLGIGTGLSREIFDIIFSHLGWTKRAFSYVGFSCEIGRDKPEPDMIFDMMAKLMIEDPREVLKIGNTVADIREGKKAGCLTAVVLSGTQFREELIEEKPDFILGSLYDLKSVINESARSNINAGRYRLV